MHVRTQNLHWTTLQQMFLFKKISEETNNPERTRKNMKRLSIAEALRESIAEEMQRDEKVFCIGEDIGIPGGFGGAFTVTLGLEKKFPDRILCPAHMTWIFFNWQAPLSRRAVTCWAAQ